MDLSIYCKKTISSDRINIFKHNCRILICGSSFTGKTKLCCDLLLQYKDNIDHIIIAASPNSHEIDQIDDLKKKTHIFEHIPSINEINSNFAVSTRKVLVIDDNYTSAFSSKEVLDYYIRGRHSNCSVIVIAHNLFFSKGKYSRDISLNTTHFILLKLRDLNQLQYLATQLYGKTDAKNVLKIYKYILEKYSYPHMLIDVSMNTDKEVELRSNIINNPLIYSFETCYKVIE